MIVRCAWLLLLLSGCQSGRAVRVSFDLESAPDVLCVLAGDGRTPELALRYDTLPDHSSLTFEAGSAARSSAVIGSDECASCIARIYCSRVIRGAIVSLS